MQKLSAAGSLTGREIVSQKQAAGFGGQSGYIGL